MNPHTLFGSFNSSRNDESPMQNGHASQPNAPSTSADKPELGFRSFTRTHGNNHVPNEKEYSFSPPISKSFLTGSRFARQIAPKDLRTSSSRSNLSNPVIAENTIGQDLQNFERSGRQSSPFPSHTNVTGIEKQVLRKSSPERESEFEDDPSHEDEAELRSLSEADNESSSSKEENANAKQQDDKYEESDGMLHFTHSDISIPNMWPVVELTNAFDPISSCDPEPV